MSVMQVKRLSKKDTDKIIIHLLIAKDIISKLEHEYGDIVFNEEADLFVNDIPSAAESIIKIWNATKDNLKECDIYHKSSKT